MRIRNVTQHKKQEKAKFYCIFKVKLENISIARIEKNVKKSPVKLFCFVVVINLLID